MAQLIRYRPAYEGNNLGIFCCCFGRPFVINCFRNWLRVVTLRNALDYIIGKLKWVLLIVFR
jgi:hypothetical protein